MKKYITEILMFLLLIPMGACSGTDDGGATSVNGDSDSDSLAGDESENGDSDTGVGEEHDGEDHIEEWIIGSYQSPAGCSIAEVSSADFSLSGMSHDEFLIDIVSNECPEGMTDSRWFWANCIEGCHTCEYDCDGACTNQEICTPTETENQCLCHPNYTTENDECVFRGALENPEFDDCGGWSLYAAFNGEQSDKAQIDIVDGELRASVTQACHGVAAMAEFRVPTSGEFPGGAALVLDYTATKTEPDAASGSFSLLVGVNAHTLEYLYPASAAEVTTARSCLSLMPYPQIDMLLVSIQAMGVCDLEFQAGLTVDNIRIEADTDCAGY
ncbi:MAG: hypothetical protein JXX29_19280 [Deltaproteobacteria bacterium]|nr:hypothetical protein [Deltaproteobacteria bacterium]MBN2673831.1 hypothetical protein [Deltaproteobacteria bacterium]